MHFHNLLLKEKGRLRYIVKCITDNYKVTVHLLHIMASYIFIAGGGDDDDYDDDDDDDECVSRVNIGTQTLVTR
jgi:hypothetical protein